MPNQPEINVASLRHLISDDYKTRIDDALNAAAHYEIMSDSAREQKYEVLEQAYGVYLHCRVDRRAVKHWYKALGKRNMAYTRATPIELAIIKELLPRLSDSSASKYGRTICYAAHKQMPVDEFGRELSTKGIQKLATAAAAAVPKKPGSGKTRPKPTRPASKGANGSDAAGKVSETKIETPALDWPVKAQRIWNEAKIASRLKLVIHKVADRDGTVLNAKCLSKT